MNPGYPPYPPQQMPVSGTSNQFGPPPSSLYPTTSSQTFAVSAPYVTQPGFANSYSSQTPNYPQPANSGQFMSYPSQPYSSVPSQPYPSVPSQPYPSVPSQPYPSVNSSYPPQYSNTQCTYPAQPQTQFYTGCIPSNPTPTPTYPVQPGYPECQSYPKTHSTAQYPQQCPTSVPSYYPNANISSGSGLNSIVQQEFDKLSPTIKPISPFNPRADAETLRKAMKGFGTDEQTLINVLTKRSNAQRLEIANQFKALFGKDLISDLKSEISGKFKDTIVALMTPLPEFLAKEVNYAIEGVGTNEETLVEILCTATNSQIYTIKDAYQRLYLRSMENDLSSDTSGHFKRLLISLIQGRRSENYSVDEAAAARDAQALMTAGVLKLGTDESTFNAILCTRSYPQLRRIIMEYYRLTGQTLEKSINEEFSGDIKNGLMAILKTVEDKPGFFAERCRDAVACAGTKDRQLIRVIVSRCEIDMLDIKRVFQIRYGKSLEQSITDDTSGNYKKTLLSLITGY